MGLCLALFRHLPSTPGARPAPSSLGQRTTLGIGGGIMDLSWPAPPSCSVNEGTPTETYLGRPQKMHLPSAQEMVDLIKQAGTGCYLYCRDIARVYL